MEIGSPRTSGTWSPAGGAPSRPTVSRPTGVAPVRLRTGSNTATEPTRPLSSTSWRGPQSIRCRVARSVAAELSKQLGQNVFVENKPGVLARVSGLFARRGYNIFSLAVAPTEDERFSRLTIVVDVENEPSSVPAEVRARPFERTHAPRGAGSGLGLAIVRAAVEAHGGRVRFVELGPPRVVVRMELPR